MEGGNLGDCADAKGTGIEFFPYGVEVTAVKGVLDYSFRSRKTVCFDIGM